MLSRKRLAILAWLARARELRQLLLNARVQLVELLNQFFMARVEPFDQFARSLRSGGHAGRFGFRQSGTGTAGSSGREMASSFIGVLGGGSACAAAISLNFPRSAR
jgi:hypothetical protein